LDPVTGSSLHSLIRPVVGPSGVSPALQEGRTLSGEVLARLDGGTLLVRIGEQRVPAETGVDLQPGERFTAKVERTSEGLVLRLVREEAPRPEGWVATVRALLGEGRAVGEVLVELANELRAALASGGGAELGALLAELDGRLAAPVPDVLAGALRSALDADPLAHALRAYAALGEGAPSEVVEAAREAALHALARSLGATDGAEAAALEAALRSGVAQLGLEPGARLDARGLARLVELFHDVLGRTLRALGAQGERLAAGLEGAGPLARGREGLLLAALLLLGGAGDATRRRVFDLALQRFGPGLRGRLVELLLAPGERAPREGAARALAALDLEQVLNGARREHGEPVHVELALPDAGRHARADVYLRGEREGDGRGEQETGRARVALSLSGLGSVRAELALAAGRLTVGFSVESERARAALSAALPELVGRLEAEGRRVAARVALGGAPHPDAEREACDIRALRERPLMDTLG